jgi:hypothetical protein
MGRVCDRSQRTAGFAAVVENRFDLHQVVAHRVGASRLCVRPRHSPPDRHHLRTRGVAGYPVTPDRDLFLECQVLIEISFLTFVTPGADQALA